MPNRIDIPVGTVFGQLAVIGETRLPSSARAAGIRAMICRCACGRTKVITVSGLRAGDYKSCGICGREVLVPASRTEIPLYGKVAAGRVTRVDDGDFDVAMGHRWRVMEQIKPGKRPVGPYAVTQWRSQGRIHTMFLHTLITGFPRVDHINHDTLDNRRFNLRDATVAQNAHNKRGNLGASSQYKGVFLDHGRYWRAAIKDNGKVRYLGVFPTEESAARAYDQEARILFGSFACTNFEDELTGDALAEWRAECEAYEAERKRAYSEYKAEWWQQRPLVTRICTVCGDEYQSKGNVSLYCSKACKKRKYAQDREQLPADTLF